jgi:bifunctional DNase/RNase
MIEMVLHRILISETSDQQYIFLKEKAGERTFPIVIGFFEAQAIHRFVNDEKYPRPMTHELLAQTITALGAKIVKVDVPVLKESTFFAVVHLATADGKTVEIDARPSDAIALAMASKAPIFVAESVIEESAAA